jgi:hypothetical protein
LIAVSENALDEVLAWLPPERHGDAIVLQNELFPSRFAALAEAPTVLVPWLLQKRGQPLTVIRPSPVWGRHAAVVARVHQALQIPVEPVSPGAGAAALRDKYAFILTINALGVYREGTLGELIEDERSLAQKLATEAHTLAAACAGAAEDERAIEALFAGFTTLSEMPARGRTAKARLSRALERARHLDLQLPELSRIEAQS